MKLVAINGKAGFDDGYYDGTTSQKAAKPDYVPDLIEQRIWVNLDAAKKNMRDRT